MDNQITFVDGMNFKPVSPNAPESVRGQIYFNADKFIAFLNKHKDEKGWVNTKMMKSKDKGTIYFILDTWKPQPKQTVDDETGEVVPDLKEDRSSPSEDYPEGINISDLPF